VLTGLAPNYDVSRVARAFGIGMGGEGRRRILGDGESAATSARCAVGAFAGRLRGGIFARRRMLFFRVSALRLASDVFIGGLPALFVLFIRFGVKESEVWQRTKHNSWSELGRGLATHWKLFLYLTLLMTMMNFASHGTDMYPTFCSASGISVRRNALC
jgi:SHS family lactate transporter-like MFS transporter